MSQPIIYLDNNATTCVAPEVFQAMAPFLQQEYANPSSVYPFAGVPAAALEKARRVVLQKEGDRVCLVLARQKRLGSSILSELDVALPIFSAAP